MGQTKNTGNLYLIATAELLRRVRQYGFAYETELCTYLCGTYGFSKQAVIQALHNAYPGLSLIRRRATDQLKESFGDQRAGYMNVYLPKEGRQD